MNKKRKYTTKQNKTKQKKLGGFNFSDHLMKTRTNQGYFFANCLFKNLIKKQQQRKFLYILN